MPVEAVERIHVLQLLAAIAVDPAEKVYYVTISRTHTSVAPSSLILPPELLRPVRTICPNTFSERAIPLLAFKEAIDMAHAKAVYIEPSHPWLTAALSEYAAIRGEIVAAISAQHSVFSYGIAAVGLLTAVAIGTTNGETGASQNAQILVTFILLVLNPVLLVVILVLWTSEVLRMERAGAYLLVLESVINSKMGSIVPMAWEGVVNPRPEAVTRKERVLPNIDAMQRWAVPLALTAIALGSVVSGVLLGASALICTLGILVVIATIYVGLIVWAYFDGNRHWLRGPATTQGKDKSNQTPESVQIWAAGLEPSSWRAHAPNRLKYLPFVWSSENRSRGLE